MIRRFILIFIACLMLISTPIGQASAYGNQTAASQTYKLMLTDNHISMSGVMNERQLHFQVPSYWGVEQVNASLDYTVTPLMNNETSSVTVKINDTFLYSFRPQAADHTQRLTLQIPNELIRKGANVLSIEGNIQTASYDDFCQIDDKHDNWFQLFNTSNVEVRHTNKPLTGSINGFYEYFLGMDVLSANQNGLVLPTDSEAVEWRAATYALAGLSGSKSLSDKTIPLYAYNSDKWKNKKALVAVALYSHLPSNLKSLMGEHNYKETAVIQVVNKDKQPTLVITSDNPDLLLKAGRLVANPELMKQIDSSEKIVDESTDVNTPKVSLNKDVSLTDTGDMIKGWNHQEKSYFVALPANRSIADASKLSIDFRYAKNLDFDRSMITVLINDTPIGSKKLTEAMADHDTLTLPIPTNLDVSGNFTVTLAFELQLEGVYCLRNPYEMPWAYIIKSSAMQLNTSDNTEMLFNNYPYPFLRDGMFNKVAVVLPDEQDEYTYQSMAEVFNLLGQYVESNEGEIQFFYDTVDSETLRNYNIIALGSYKHNKVIRDQNEQLYFQYGESGDGFQSNEKMSIDSEYGKRLGSLQLIQSPYEAGYGLLAITGSGSEYYYLASKLIGNESSLWKIYGDGVLTDKDGDIYPYRFKKEANQEEQSIVEQLTQRTDMIGFMAAVLLVLLLVLVSLILMIRKYRTKRRGDQ